MIIPPKYRSLVGNLRVPSDKSLTHRALMLGSIATEECVIRRPLLGEDCVSTAGCLAALGVRVREMRESSDEVTVKPSSWTSPTHPLDCGNSGTTMRLISGLLASRPIESVLIGDSSLSRRPMRRVVDPLRLMGADIHGDTAPLTIHGTELTGIHYHSPVASAQVKSCLLLAGLRATGVTSVTEPALSRDHSERMLSAMGASVRHEGLTVSISPTDRLLAFDFSVPADISSAAFAMVAVCLLPGSEITFQDLSVNPTRTGIFDVLEQVGAVFHRENPRESLGEPVAEVTLRTPTSLAPFTIEGDLVPRLIDEIPVLAVLATQCKGTSVIRNASELRVKETDRIQSIGDGLRRMGAKVELLPDGMVIEGPTPLTGITIDSAGDHRVGMAFAVAALIAEGDTHIENEHAIHSSYPSFWSDFASVGLPA
jgi:3-phosphoshikimate 1-carboxyvinyltransferase